MLRLSNKIYCQKFAPKKLFLKQPIVQSSTIVNNDNVEKIDLPKAAQVVICGGGVMGAAVAYHLSLMGLGPETVILESNRYDTSIIFFFSNNKLLFTLF